MLSKMSFAVYSGKFENLRKAGVSLAQTATLREILREIADCSNSSAVVAEVGEGLDA